MGYRRGLGGDPFSSGGGRKCFGICCSAVSAWAYAGRREGGWIRMRDRCRRVRRAVNSMVVEKRVGALPHYTVWGGLVPEPFEVAFNSQGEASASGRHCVPYKRSCL